MNILQAIDDAAVFAPWFTRGEWKAWRTFLAALFALPMDAEALDLYRRCTGRQKQPAEAFTEAALIIGRRGGKSFIMAVIAVFLAVFRDYRPFLQPGERATILVIAVDRKQARVIMRYVVALLEGVPMLRKLIERQSTDSIDLLRSVTIEVSTASFRTVRGYTIAACLCDEIAFWSVDEGSANPDSEILAAIRPAMATIPGAMLFIASSPYARRGELWRVRREYFGKDDAPVLVWQAGTKIMNPTVPTKIITEAYNRDSAKAAAEFGAEFRKDIEGFVSREIVEACVSLGVYERGRIARIRYSGFIDPSGGSVDSMTMAIGHAEGKTIIVDCIREMPAPFRPEAVTEEFAATFKAYGITRIQGDRYAGEWPREAFQRHGINYEPSAKPKSDLYRDLLPKLASGEIDLVDNARLVNQLCALERRTARGGRDSIDHAPGAHDDVANALAGLAGTLVTKTSTYTLEHVS